MRSAFAVAGAVAALGACGGGDAGDDGYPQEAVETFVASCGNEPNASERACRCVIERLQETMPYPEFAEADAALKQQRRPRPASLRKLRAAVVQCT